jgi:Flp pilus assembly protein TadD
MAGDLVSDGSMPPALRLLDRALEVAPSSHAALLGQGVALERLGRFKDAIGPLKRLLDLDPDNAEGGLRLAVNLARTGHEREAEPLLRRLIDNASEEWLVAIAYQELARMLIASGRRDHAQALIRQGLERLPHNQPLSVLLAYVLESSGRPWDATMVVENLRPRSATDLSEPRLRYVMWPILEIDSALVGFTRQATNLQPDLLECVASAEARRAG